MIIELYIKFRKLAHKVRSVTNLWKFVSFLIKNKVFKSESPEVALRVLQKFFELQYKEYENKIVMNRDPMKSTLLFRALVNEYFNTKSSVTLNQILTVLKEEFIERGEQ